MDGITIRPATPDDKPEWLRMRQTLWPDEIEYMSFEEMDCILADPLMPVFLAVRADGSTSASLSVKLGGFVEAGTRKYAEGGETSPVGYIEGWYVDADLRGQGIGGALMQAAENWARGQGLTEMGSDTWLDNEISIQAHIKLGYEEEERLVHFLKRL
jgi:aminoglycoside 6'-N-acetyltransferase I